MKRKFVKILSFVMVLAMVLTGIPLYAFADEVEQTRKTVENTQAAEKTIGFELGGGMFITAYTAPEAYPIEALPTADDVTNPGYEFEGWYDNAEFTGDKMTVETVNAHTEESIVLYAKWQQRFYIGDIPTSVNANGGTMSIGLQGGGFYENDRVDIKVESENTWRLKNNTYYLDYSLTPAGSKTPYENDNIVLSLGANAKSTSTDMDIKIGELGKDTPTGNYSDVLTFIFDFTETKYTVKFNADEGTVYDEQLNEQQEPTQVAITEKSYTAGTSLSELPTAQKSGFIFVGWSLDSEGNDMINSEDRLLGDIEVYAVYSEQKPLEKSEIAVTARATDVDTDYIIQVVDNSEELTVEEVKAALTLKNVTDDAESSFIVTAGENHIYTLSREGGWVAGCLYKFTVASDKVGTVSFVGYDSTIDHYDFNVFKEEVKNASLNDDIKYVSSDDIKSIDVANSQTTSLSRTLINVKEGEAQSDNLSGTFKYAGSAKLKAGDVIGVYDGSVMPDVSSIDSTIKTDDSEVGYYNVVAVGDDGTVEFKSAGVEDVMFVPDILPLNRANPIADGEETKTISVPAKDLTFSSDNIANSILGLDEDTTVDIGDFVAFQKESSTDKLYGKITGVVAAIGYYDITYKPTTFEEMQSCMDIQHTEDVSGDDMLRNTDIPAAEEEIKNQAIASGFADEVANQIKDVWETSGSYESFLDEIEEKTGASEVSIQSNGALENMTKDDDDDDCNVKLVEVTPRIGKNLKNFDGVDAPSNGVHLDLTVVVDIELKAEFKQKEKKDDDNDTPSSKGGVDSLIGDLGKTEVGFSIRVTTKFVQEVCMKSDIGACAEWGLLGIIPYIKEVKLSAGIKIYEYTGISLDVQAKFEYSEGLDDNDFGMEVQGYADYFEDAMKNGYTNISSTDAVKNILAENGVADYGDDVSIVKSLGKRYSEMLQDIEYQTIFSQEIFSVGVSIAGICKIGLTFDFNIDAEMILIAGINYWYRCGKQYTFTIKLFSMKVSTETSDLIPEEEEFNAYIMGSAGIRAYLNIYFGVDVLKIASVGLNAQIGGYIELYGFLYYTQHKTDGKVTNEQLMGNLYCEIGIFLEVKFIASMAGGAVSYCPTLLSMKVPLLKLGNEKVVVDFDYSQEDLPDVVLKNAYDSYILPKFIYNMQYLDMDDGIDEETDDYFTAQYNTESFDFKITNPAFTFDSQTGTVAIIDRASKPSQDGELIITYKVPAGYMCKTPIQRKVKLHWDNLRDGYFIAFNSNGGSDVPMIYGKYDTEIGEIANPTRQGYTFGGWYRDAEFAGEWYTIPDTIPNEDIILYAKWIANDTPYTVERYTQNIDGTYKLYDTDSTNTGKTDSEVTAEAKSIKGYTTPVAETQTIKPDGSTVYKYYYGLSDIKIKFYSGEELVAAGSYNYGAALPTPVTVNPGYYFKGWKVEGASDAELIEDGALVPNEDTNYQAVWTPRDDIPYEIKYLFQSANDSTTTVAKIVTGVGSSDEVITVEPLTEQEAYGYTLRNGTLPTGTISADGTTVIRVYYDRVTYDLTCVLNNGQSDDVITGVRHGAYIVPDTPYKDGYDFVGWYTNEECTEEFDFLMPMSNKTIYAKWEPGYVSYRVEHYLQSGDSYILKEATIETAKAETEITPIAKSYEGYTAKEITPVTPSVDGSTVAAIYYDVASYTLTMNYNSTTETRQLKYGEALPVVSVSNKMFKGWYTDEACSKEYTGTMPGQDLTVYAKLESTTTTVYALTVNHHLQNVDGTYSLYKSDVYYAKKSILGTSVTVTPLSIENFVSPSQKSVTVKKDDTYDMYYDRVTYSVTGILYYDDDGASVTNSYTALYGEFFGALESEVPTRAGYQFLGWYMDAECCTPYSEEITDYITVYAKWKALSVMYTVEYALQNPDGSYTVEDEGIFYAKTDTYVTPAVKLYDDHVILPEAQTAKVKGDGTLVVRYLYDLYQYRITYMQDNGEEDIEKDYRYQQNIDDMPTVTKKGYTFTTWLGTDETYYEIPHNMPDIDLAFTAQWMLDTYNVVYDLAGGEVDGDNVTSYTVHDDAFTVINPTRYGYIFAGWTGTELSTKTTELTVPTGSVGNRVYTANWTHIPYYITLDANGGSISSSKVTYYIDSASFTLEKPTRAGYTFAGWKLNNEGTANVSTVITKGTSGDYSYTAQWTENTYTVSYSAYGAECNVASSGSANSQTVLYTQTFTLRGASAFKRTGYTFAGWSTTAGGSKVYSGDQSVSELVTTSNGTLTLYPVWNAITYTITFHTYNNSSQTFSKTLKYDESYTAEPGAKNGAVFLGWATTDTKGNLEFSGNYNKGKVVKNATSVQGKTVHYYGAWSLTTSQSVTISPNHVINDSDENSYVVKMVQAGSSYSNGYKSDDDHIYALFDKLSFYELTTNYGYNNVKIDVTINYKVNETGRLSFLIMAGSNIVYAHDCKSEWDNETGSTYTRSITAKCNNIGKKIKYFDFSTQALGNDDDEFLIKSFTIKMTFSKSAFD